MTEYGLFLGCIIPLRYPGIESSTKAVLDKLGVKHHVLDGASCCPAPGVFRSFDQNVWYAVGARNLALAEERGWDVMTLCNGCFGTLNEVAHFLKEDSEKMAATNAVLSKSATNRRFVGKTRVRHFAEFLANDVGTEKLAAAVKERLDVNIACFYGCHFLKPSKINKVDDPERPTIIDKIIECMGMKSVQFRDKYTCCGAGGGVRARTPDIANKMTEQIINNMKDAGVQCIVNVCPFCHLQFDQFQKGKPDGIPVLHLSQLLGLVFGLDRAQLGLESHATPVKL